MSWVVNLYLLGQRKVRFNNYYNTAVGGNDSSVDGKTGGFFFFLLFEGISELARQFSGEMRRPNALCMDAGDTMTYSVHIVHSFIALCVDGTSFYRNLEKSFNIVLVYKLRAINSLITADSYMMHNFIYSCIMYQRIIHFL